MLSTAPFSVTGLHVEKGFFADRKSALQKWADEIAALPPDTVWHYYEPDLLNSGNKILSRTEKFCGIHEELTRLIESSKLQDYLAQLFSEPAILFKEKINYKLMGNAGFEAHQDIQAGWRDYTGDFISVGIAIDPQLGNGGCLEFIQDSFGGRMVGDLWKPLLPDQVDFSRFIPVPCEPGDVLFFDGCIPHRSFPNRTVPSQRIFYLTFNRKSAGDFREKYYADKFKGFPPDYYRESGKKYEYKV